MDNVVNEYGKFVVAVLGAMIFLTAMGIMCDSGEGGILREAVICAGNMSI